MPGTLRKMVNAVVRSLADSMLQKSHVGTTSAALHFLRGTTTRADFASLVAEGYLANPDVYGCIRGISELMYQVPLKVKNGSPDENPDTWEVLKKHPLYALLNPPNPIDVREDFFDRMAQDLFLSGNLVIKMVGPNVGPPTELWRLRPDWVEVISGGRAEPIKEYKYFFEGRGKPEKFETIPADQIIHMQFPNPAGSPLQAARLPTSGWLREPPRELAAASSSLTNPRA